MAIDGNSYVYLHIREDTGMPFYVGIGCKKKYKRSFETSFSKRNNIWINIFNKTSCISNVIYTDLTWGEACEIERTLISFWGRINNSTGILANMTDGGEGAAGVIFTKERIEKISNALKGKSTSDVHKAKCRQRRQTEETKEKIRLLKTGIKASEETRAKMRINNMKGILASVKKISKPVIDTVTGEKFDKVRDAAKKLGITHGYLSGMLLGRYKNKTTLKYYNGSTIE